MKISQNKKYSPGEMNYKRLLLLLFILIFAGIFQGCKTVGPNYMQPAPILPDDWDIQIDQKLKEQPSTELESWWNIFSDPVLNQLIEQARDNNKNLKSAYSRILESRANLSGVSGEKLPFASANLSVSESKLSDYGSFSELAPEGGFKPQSMFSTGVNAAWEIDVFGRIRRAVEAAGYEYQTTIEDYYDVMVVLLAEVATNYMNLRTYQQLIISTELNSQIQKDLLDLAQSRYELGLTTYLDVLQAKYNLAETNSLIPDYKTGEFKASTRLAILLGTTRDSLNIELFVPGNIPQPDSNIVIGIPTDLLRQRPDIRAAEKYIAYNNANTGVATADLYPTFALNGFFTFQSKSVANWFTIPGLNWGAFFPVSWDIFNRKRIKANISMNEQRTQQALLNYENTVLQAYGEVEDALVSFSNQKERHIYLNEAVQSSQEAVELVEIQYNTGLTDFLNVLDAERNLLNVQTQQIESSKNIANDAILLYKALGGGWKIPQDSITNTGL